MKKILFVAASAILLAAGCQKTEILNPAGEPSMAFTTEANKLTKAYGVADAAATELTHNLKAQDFRVWVYGAEEFPQTSVDDLNEIYDHMENLHVSYNNETSAWETVAQHFWPGKELELKFFAVSGGSFINTTTSPVTIDAENNTLAVTDFTIEDQAYNADLMVADYAEQNQYAKEVDLTFRHALSKVEFVFKTIPADGISVYVQEVKVEGLANKGTLNVTYPEYNENGNTGVGDAYIPKTAESSFAWDLTNATTTDFTDDWTETYSGTDFPAEIDGVAVTDDDKVAMKITATGEQDPQVYTTWLMLPQDITDKKVKITYLLNERRVEGEFDLDKSFAEWGDNQYIRYVVTLAPNLISFNPTVDDWDVVGDTTHEN